MEESGLQPASEARVKALLTEEGGAQVGEEKDQRVHKSSSLRSRAGEVRFRGEAGPSRGVSEDANCSPSLCTGHLSPAAGVLIPGSWITSPSLILMEWPQEWRSHQRREKMKTRATLQNLR